MNKKIFNVFIVLFVIPSLIALGVFIFEDRSFIFISLLIAIGALVPVFMSFEKKESNTRKMVVLATLIAISVVGRFIFAALPGF